MSNARNLRLGPNATYIPLTCVGVWRWGNVNLKFRVGVNANFSVFRYQHVGIGNTKFRVFASQCNIGFTVYQYEVSRHHEYYSTLP